MMMMMTTTTTTMMMMMMMIKEIIVQMVKMITTTMFLYDTPLSSSGPLSVTQLYFLIELPLRDTESARTGLDTPLQSVSFPLQDPFARQTLTDDPLRTNPSSQWKYTLFGYVVSFP